MGLRARDVMDTQYWTLTPDMTVAEAVAHFERVSSETGRRRYGMMVLDDGGRLAGILSMFDILLLLRPRNIHIWGEMEELEVGGYIDEVCDRAKSLLVSDLMTTEIITVNPDTHLLVLVDIMVRNHIRRAPVIEKGRVIGIVYISEVVFHLMKRLLPVAEPGAHR